MVVPPGQAGESLLRCWLSAGGVARQEAEVRARAEEVLEFLSLAPLRDELAENLSGDYLVLQFEIIDDDCRKIDLIACGHNGINLIKALETQLNGSSA